MNEWRGVVVVVVGMNVLDQELYRSISFVLMMRGAVCAFLCGRIEIGLQWECDNWCGW